MPIGNGNVRVCVDMPGDDKKNARLPDIHDPLLTEEEMPDRATFSMEIPDSIPDDFDDLPEEEQQRIRARIRFRGIRLRSDLDCLNVPVSKETMEI